MTPLKRDEFIKRYLPFVNTIIKDTGIFAGTLFSQAILESSSAPTYLVGSSKLSKEANNLFGIKADKNWKGKRYNIKTREVKNNVSYYILDDFRAYDTPEQSMQDYVNFLLKNKRYKEAGVFKAKNVKEQAEALKKAGYATAPNYAEIVTKVYNSILKFLGKTGPPPIQLTTLFLFVGLLGVYKYVYK